MLALSRDERNHEPARRIRVPDQAGGVTEDDRAAGLVDAALVIAHRPVGRADEEAALERQTPSQLRHSWRRRSPLQAARGAGSRASETTTSRSTSLTVGNRYE